MSEIGDGSKPTIAKYKRENHRNPEITSLF